MRDHQLLSRRRFLGWTGQGLALGGLGLPVLLAGCAPAPPVVQPTAVPTAAGASIKLPAYVPFPGGPPADLPGTASGVDPAYFTFPSRLVRSVPQPPGDGSEVSAIVFLAYGTPPPMEQNTAWQALNRQLGVTLRVAFAPVTEYQAKVNTIIAGADLPDFILNAPFSPFGVIPSLPDFARTRCADLTAYLSGNAVKDYPNLANYSTYSWRSGVVDGALYGVPVSRGPFGNVFMYRQDLFERAGISSPPTTADEFRRILVALTRPQDNQWGVGLVGGAGGGTSWLLESTGPLVAAFGAPNRWRLEPGGNLVRDFETEEYRAAVGFVRDLYAAGVFHPNSQTNTSAAQDADFRAGRIAVSPIPWGAYLLTWSALAGSNPAARLAVMPPFAHDGGTPIYHTGPGHFGVTFLKQAAPERIKMLLSVMNVLAAPFGTEEWLLNYYGVKDVDYTLDADGAPQPTALGRMETLVPWRYVTSPPPALFDPARSQEFATLSHAAEAAMVAARLDDPTLGLFSPTAFKAAIPAETAWYAGITDIVQARRPLQDLDQLLTEWRTTVGDAMRREYLTALQAAAGR